MEINRDVAYILGALRDGCFIRNEKYRIHRIRIYQKNLEWVQMLSGLFSIVYGVIPIVSKDERDNVWSLMVNSVNVFRELSDLSEYPGKQCEWNIPSSILQSSTEAKIQFIKGFFDAEGGVPHVEKHKIEAKNIRVHFTQANEMCLEQIRGILNELDVKTGRVCGPYFKKGYRNPVYRLKIHGIREVARYSGIIGSEHPEKRIRLSIISNMAQDQCRA